MLSLLAVVSGIWGVEIFTAKFFGIILKDWIHGILFCSIVTNLYVSINRVRKTGAQGYWTKLFQYSSFYVCSILWTLSSDIVSQNQIIYMFAVGSCFSLLVVSRPNYSRKL